MVIGEKGFMLSITVVLRLSLNVFLLVITEVVVVKSLLCFEVRYEWHYVPTVFILFKFDLTTLLKPQNIYSVKWKNN
jgi:hypothetical protein